ncbi:alpha/beta fold hydrolase [Ulvibacterium sp.]|uniref:alpha/beta fold hydrolase n=1 Tax=Ulvibacterium sp. TaxID=2665914 RepID=UPI003BAB752E
MRLNPIIRFLYIMMLGIALINCATTQNTQRSNTNGKSVEYILMGNGSPTLVFETGMGPSISTWDKILDSLSKHTRIYAYNRPGYGNSNVKKPPRNIVEAAQQLHANLVNEDIRPPYILVGHSLGGLLVNMFARLYPRETIGVIFIDASHPEQFEYFKADQKFLHTMLVTSTRKGGRSYEYDLISSASEDFQSVPQFPKIPVSVLTAGKSSPLENKKLRTKWLEFQKDLVKLGQNNVHRIIENSGHYIHRDNPTETIAEILIILDLAKKTDE